MTKVEIEVTDDYKLHPFWTKSRLVNTQWLDIIPTIDSVITKQCLNDESNAVKIAAESALDNIKLAMTDAHNLELKRQEDYFNSRIRDLESTLKINIKNEMETNNLTQVHRLETEIIELKAKKDCDLFAYSTQKELTEQLNASLSSQLILNEQLKNENERLLSMVPEKPLSSQQLGKVAEEEVSSTICEFLPCEVIDVAHAGGHGDRHIRFHAKSVNRYMELFLEVKNQKDLRKDEIDRFLIQVKEDAKNGKINCGMFLSLKTKSIPFKLHTEVEILDVGNNKRIPIIWLATSSKASIQSSILLMIALFESIQREQFMQETAEHTSDDFRSDFQMLKDIIPDMLSYIDKQDAHISSQMKGLQEMMDDMRKQKESLSEIVFKTDSLKRNLSFLSDPDEEAVRILTECMTSKDKPLNKINKADLVISHRKIIEKAGGLARVRTLVENKRQKNS